MKYNGEIKKDVVCVISRYNEDLKWTEESIKVKNTRVIYNKGDDIKTDNIESVRLTNKGREGDTYLKHIISNYDNLSIYTIFLQGELYDNHTKNWHTPLVDIEWVIENIGQLKEAKIRYIGLNKSRGDSGWGRICNFDDKFEIYKKRQLKDNLEITQNAFPHLFSEKHMDILCNYCGMFCVSKEAILFHPKKFYEELDDILLKNPDYGYCLERLWKHIFDPRCKDIINIEYVKKLVHIN